MADQYIQVAPNSTGLKVDTTELVVGANTVERQRMIVSDPTSATGFTNVIEGDTGQNALIVTRARKEIAFSTTIVGALSAIDCSNYSWISVQVSTNGTASTTTFQASNDGTNWSSCSLAITPASGGNPNQLSTAGTGIFHGPVVGRYFRLNVTGISAGTTSGVIELFSVPIAMPNSFTSAAQSGTWTVLNAPTTTGGLTAVHVISAASTNTGTAKASAGQLYNVQAFNLSASARFVKFFNKSTAPTLGTDTPVLTYLIPGTSGPGAGFVVELSNGLAFSSGIAYAITGGIADADATAIGAGDVALNLQIK